MRLAWIAAGDEGYGVRQAMVGITRELSDLGVEVSCVSVGNGPVVDAMAKAGGATTVLKLGAPPRWDGGWMSRLSAGGRLAAFNVRASAQIAEALSMLKVDAAVVRLPNLLWVAGMATRRLTLPCAWLMARRINNSLPFEAAPRFYRWLTARYEIACLANSEFTASSLGGRHRAEVVYLGADQNRFNPDTVVAAQWSGVALRDEAIVFGMFARITPFKGQAAAIRALASVVRSGQDAHLLLVGGRTDEEYSSEVDQLIGEFDLDGRVHFTGAVDDVERYYPLVHVVISNSLGPEGFGLTVVEAMMMRRPVLAHALGGPAETVIDGITGWHYHRADAAALEAGMQKAIAVRDQWPGMGAAARQHALRQFTMRRATERLLSAVEAHR